MGAGASRGSLGSRRKTCIGLVAAWWDLDRNIMVYKLSAEAAVVIKGTDQPGQAKETRPIVGGSLHVQQCCGWLVHVLQRRDHEVIRELHAGPVVRAICSRGVPVESSYCRLKGPSPRTRHRSWQ